MEFYIDFEINSNIGEFEMNEDCKNIFFNWNWLARKQRVEI